ncbi:hypothetical protein FJT64_027393 [Amphibalanus amphitrite]|uniref:Uncharacterized protein n=1 Tax=Amphibalanus amphitrite TaxID=1232801 RepID=A0A6A4WDH6_AMPAM|nr:hypothetical protein FJT64_027393 [Amphibalanus amphitrite]
MNVERLEDAIDGLESRLVASFSRELHEFRESLTAEIDKLNERVRDLERHVEVRDGVIDQLTDDLRQSRADITALQTRVEDAEINSRLPCLIFSADIDRAHRLPGANHRIIVRFVRSGEGSLRDRIMTRRMELKGKDLYVNESLTKMRGLIFRSLLAAKREKKVYTVYSRGGQVFFKQEQYGTGKRVDSLEQVRRLGYTVLER